MGVQFPTVTEDGKIETLPFLEACRGLENVYNDLGTTLLIVKKDLIVNVEKLSKIYHDSNGKYKYINELVLKEKEDPYMFAIDSLLWLKRSLELFQFINEKLIAESRKKNPSDCMKDIVVDVYNNHLKCHHNWIVQNIFQIMMSFFPSRLICIDAAKKLVGEDDADEKTVIDSLELYIFKLVTNLSVINKLYSDWNLEALLEMNS